MVGTPRQTPAAPWPLGLRTSARYDTNMSSTAPEPPVPAPVDRLAAALAAITPSALCTLCVVELKQARNAGQPEPEVHPGVVMAGVIINGVPSTMMLCEIRHPLNVGAPPPPSLLVAPADAVPDPAARRALGLVSRIVQ